MPDDCVDAIAETREPTSVAVEAVQTGCSRARRVDDAIVVVDRIGREVVRNAAAERFRGARHGEVLAEEAIAELLAARR